MALVAAIVAVCVLVIIAPLLGARRALVALFVLSVTVVPAPILSLGDSGGAYIVDISSPVITISTYSIAIVVVSIWAALTRRAQGGWVIVPALAYLIVGALVSWPLNDAVGSGTLHMAVSCLAWVCGLGIARLVRERGLERFMAMTLAFVGLVLAGPTWFQWMLGVGVQGYGDRAGGIFAHPSTVGKVAIVVLCLALPLTQSLDSRVKKFAYVTLVLAASASVPSLSRANILGTALVILFWLATTLNRQNLKQTIGVVSVAVIAAIPFVAPLIQRFELDPEGDERPELTLAALRQIPRFIAMGMGPNNYVSTVAPVESIVATSGYPVHNTFLLFLAELGVIGLAAFAPLLLTVLFAAWPFQRRGQARAYSASLGALVIGVVFVGMTGWGLLRQPLPELILFAAAYLWSNMRDSLGPARRTIEAFESRRSSLSRSSVSSPSWRG